MKGPISFITVVDVVMPLEYGACAIYHSIMILLIYLLLKQHYSFSLFKIVKAYLFAHLLWCLFITVPNLAIDWQVLSEKGYISEDTLQYITVNIVDPFQLFWMIDVRWWVIDRPYILVTRISQAIYLDPNFTSIGIQWWINRLGLDWIGPWLKNLWDMGLYNAVPYLGHAFLGLLENIWNYDYINAYNHFWEKLDQFWIAYENFDLSVWFHEKWFSIKRKIAIWIDMTQKVQARKR